MPGLGWGEKDNMTPAERKKAKKRAEEQLAAQKAQEKAKKAKADKTPRSNPRHSRGAW